MENKFQTSFIPQKPLTQTFSQPPRTTNFFTLVSTIIFITVLALCGGVFGYQKYLQNQNAGFADQLRKITAEFQPSFLAEMTRLDNRLVSTKTLLSNHLAVSTFFDFLSKNTLKNVRFSSFSYVSDGTKITVSMKGQANGFAAVALQSMAFGTADNLKVLRNPTIGDLNLDASGNVSFGFATYIQPNSMLYRSALVPAPVVPTPTITPGTTTASTTKSQTASTTTSTTTKKR